MKNLVLLLLISLLAHSCKVNEKPQFLRVENIKVLESTAEQITLTVDAYFMNPNDVKGELKTDEIMVLINDNEMAKVSSESFKVPAKKEFSIPLKANISTDSILSNQSIGGLIGSLFSKTIKVQYKGDIEYKVFGFSHTYYIDRTENIKIKF
ncbi:MAG: hypothetical protein EX254_08200 [Flavobacteriaceae bacterium]|nr:hypothetical protein [Bacteroidia bacterium]NND12300.1 hypothetical protein [Flavobacteriaceae bacterium]NNK28147.1 hypothetical protein [Flavobacteriaceae bacterium]NNL61264.1 hypothetical protein [Flavobacteriaceae bacterium]RZV61143.1 MAG: hypothetical protein EX254_08200 [Flavobacteriaceae bacterium]